MTATSEAVPNLGEKVLQCQTAEGHQRTMIVQVADMSRPLLSASRLNDTGNAVILPPGRPGGNNFKTGEEAERRRVGRTFLLDVWVEVTPGKGFARP